MIFKKCKYLVYEITINKLYNGNLISIFIFIKKHIISFAEIVIIMSLGLRYVIVGVAYISLCFRFMTNKDVEVCYKQ